MLCYPAVEKPLVHRQIGEQWGERVGGHRVYALVAVSDVNAVPGVY